MSLRMLLRAVVQTLRDVGYFALLLLLFMFVFSLLGLEFFANRFHFDPVTGDALLPSDPGYLATPLPTHMQHRTHRWLQTTHTRDNRYAAADVPRSHFDNLLWSVVTVFQVLTMENWNEVPHAQPR